MKHVGTEISVNPNNYYNDYYFSTSCGSLPNDSKASLWSTYKGPSGSITCIDGCTAVSNRSDDGAVFTNAYLNAACDKSPDNCAQYGTGWHYNAYFQTCEPPPPQCPDGQTLGPNGKCKDACPAGMVQQADGTCKPKANECPAGQTRAPDGSCIDNQCPAGQTKGPDGTCKPDACPAGQTRGPDGACHPQEDDDKPDNCPAGQKADENGKCQYDESFSGGDDCSAPPTCSGSPILCGQARIQWRIDCNTRRNTNVSGGTCASVPVCTGEKCDAVEYAQLIQQWKTACALEKLAAGGTTQPGDTSGQPDWTKVTGMSQDPGVGASADDTKVLTDKSLSPNDLDQSGFGGGSCMGFVSGSAGGDLANGFAADLLNPPAFWCNYVAAIKAVMILLGAVAAAYILSRPT